MALEALVSKYGSQLQSDQVAAMVTDAAALISDAGGGAGVRPADVVVVVCACVWGIRVLCAQVGDVGCSLKSLDQPCRLHLATFHLLAHCCSSSSPVHPPSPRIHAITPTPQTDLSLAAQALKLFVTLCRVKPDAAGQVADAVLPAALSLVTSPLLQVRVCCCGCDNVCSSR